MTSLRDNHRGAAAAQRGGTAIGFLFGVTAGLAVAAGIALVVTRAPVPFVNKNPSASVSLVQPDGGRLPDPNRPLQRRADEPAERQVMTAPPGGAPIVASAPVSPDAMQVPTYLLQAGAYRSQGDADAMRARLALIGFEAQVQMTSVNSETLFRVRVGPYEALDTMNRARAQLANNGIEASVVRTR